MARFIRWLLAALAIGAFSAGTAHARDMFWAPYGNWSGDRYYRYDRDYRYDRHYRSDRNYRYKRKQDSVKSESTRKPQVQEIAKGPLLIVISIADQRISLYDNGALIARSSVSTGVKGHPTPLGVFSVISKSKWHQSNIYSNAPMPYMQRITWSGIALHAGVLPGYPASHGCIRLTNDFAIRLWHLTRRGTRVIIAHDEVRPVEVSNPRLFVAKAKAPSGEPDSGSSTLPISDVVTAAPAPLVSNAKAQEDTKAPQPAPAGAAPQKVIPISVFVSRKLSKLFVRQGFTPLFDVPVEIKNQTEPMGTHVFTAMGPDNDGAAMRWTVVTVPERSSPGPKTSPKSQREHAKQIIQPAMPTPDKAGAALNRIQIPQEATERIAQMLTPGSSLILSDYGISDETGQDTDFIVLTR